MGDDILYSPLAHLPRSIVRQRSLQKGNSASDLSTSLRQIGQRKLMIFFLAGIVNSLVQQRTSRQLPATNRRVNLTKMWLPEG